MNMPVTLKSPEKYMSLAIELASKARERTYPNPMVGAVIVKNGRVIGRGYHRKAGGDHAEVAAIKSVVGSCKGATMFVTLEPCDHYGKTPPCTIALISSGIKEVHAAMKDPNPVNSGKGTRRLRKHGIKVNVGLLEDAARDLNRKYVKFITRKLPYVTLKLAETLDGRIAAPDGTSKWISCEKSRGSVKKMRATFDAVMTGIGTVLSDDPFLLEQDKKGYPVKRIIVDSTLKIPEKSNIMKTAAKSPVIIATTSLAPAAKVARLRKQGIEVMFLRSKGGMVELSDLMRKLAANGIVNIFCEGGARLAGSLLDEKLADEVLFYISPKILGAGKSSIASLKPRSINDSIKLRDITVSISGDDVVLRGKTCFRE